MTTEQTAAYYTFFPIFSSNAEVLLLAQPAEKQFKTEFKKLDYEISFYQNIRGLYCVVATRKTAKMKYPKEVFRHGFSSRNARAKFLVDTLAKWQGYENRKAAERQAKSAARSEFKNPFTVGQIFYDSWGYDQTNVDFYQITEVKNKSVILREIAAIGVGDSRVKPDAGNFTGEPKLKPIQIRTASNGITCYINGQRGSISLYNSGDKGVYFSTYH